MSHRPPSSDPAPEGRKADSDPARSRLLTACLLASFLPPFVASSTTVALLTASFPASERGRVLGLNVSSVFTGLSVGPLAGGILTGAFGWRTTFLVVPPMSLATLFLSSRAPKVIEDRHGRGPFDLAGALIYGAIAAALIYGLATLPGVQGMIVVGASLVAVIPFLSLEARAEQPLIDPRLFGNPMFAGSSLSALAFFTTTLSVPFVLSLYLQFVREISPAVTGLILLVQPIDGPDGRRRHRGRDPGGLRW